MRSIRELQRQSISARRQGKLRLGLASGIVDLLEVQESKGLAHRHARPAIDQQVMMASVRHDGPGRCWLHTGDREFEREKAGYHCAIRRLDE